MYINIHIYICIHRYICIYAYICMYVYIFMYLHIFCKHTHPSLHTHIPYFLYIIFGNDIFSAKIPTRPTSAAGATTCQKDSRVHTRTYTST